MTVISESTKNDLLEHIKIDPRKIRIVHNCVSSDLHPFSQRFNTAKPIILQIGTKPNKNIENVAQALKNLPCHLRIIGRLSDKQIDVLSNCEIDYSSKSNITDEEIFEEYRRCDMLIFASTYEGFGLPIVEAQAVGRPVVTSNIMSMPEVAGNAACFVDPFDVSSIREGIIRIINDSHYRIKLIEYGLENVKRFQKEENCSTVS